MEADEYKSINKNIRKYVHNIRKGTDRLKGDLVAEWALLTTIACWGTPEGIIRIISFTFAILFFSCKIKPPKKSKFHFIYIMEQRIRYANITIGQKKNALKRLYKVRSITKNRNIILYLKRCWKFFVGYVFLMFSSVYTILHSAGII